MILRLLLLFSFWGISGSFVTAQPGVKTFTLEANDPQVPVITQTVNNFLVSLNADTENEAYRKVAIFFSPELLEDGLPNLETRLALKTAFEHKGWYANPVKITNISGVNVNGFITYDVQLERMPVVGGVPPPISIRFTENKPFIVGFKGL